MAADDTSGKASYDYAKYPREFISYKWYKPLLVALLAFVFYVIMVILLVITASVWAGDPSFIDSIGTSYDDMNIYTGPGALIEFGNIALLLPALVLAGLVVRDRPFSSYSTSRGGWKWGVFFLCVLIAVALYALDLLIESVLFPSAPIADAQHFAIDGLVACIILVPFQCLAEEYIFRGYIMQTFGAWTKLPAVAIIVSALAFTIGHAYNLIGMIAIAINGLIWGFIVWKSRGLEATSALHIVNNMTAFMMEGLGLSAATSEVGIESLAVSVVIDVVYAAAVLLLGKKFGWFEPTGDGTAKFNAKKRAKMELKQRIKEA